MRRLALFLLVILSMTAPGVDAAEASLAALMPDDVIGYVRLSGAGSQLDQFLASDLRRELEALEPVKQALAHPKWSEFLGHLKNFQDATGKDPVQLLKGLAGKEVLVGARLGFGGPEFIVVAQTESEKVLEESLQTIKSVLEKQGAQVEFSESTHHERKIEFVQGKFAHARLGSIWALSNSMAAVERVIDLVAAKSSSSLQKSAVFSRAKAAHHDNALVSLAVRPQFIPNYHVPDKFDNALGSILLGGWLGALDTSELLTASARIVDGALDVKVASFPGEKARGDKAQEKYAGFYPEVIPSGLRERLEKRGVLAVTELHRNLAQWWEHREELLKTSAVGGLIEFTNTMNIFFSPRSFQDEVLPDLGSTIAIVSRNQEYKNLKEAPTPAIPAFAAIFELKNVEESADSMRSAFQSIVAIINIDQANKKKEGMSMMPRIEKVGEVDMHTVAFNTSAKSKDKDKKPGMLHNFTPSLAVAGSRVILSSSAELTRILIEELNGMKEAATATAVKAVDTLAIDGPAVRAILSANREVLIAQNMLENGKSKAQAETEIGLLLDVLKHVRTLRLHSARKGEAMHLDLNLSTNFGGSTTVEKKAAVLESTDNPTGKGKAGKAGKTGAKKAVKL